MGQREINKVFIINESNYNKDNAKPIEYIIDNNNCWLCIYPTSNNKGYPVIIRNGKKYRGNRYIYELYNGEIPENMEVCHKCDNPSCINPEHLFLGTHQDNMDDKKVKNRYIVSNETKKYLSEINKKLTNEQALKVKEMLIKKYPHWQIAEEMEISKSTVRRIKQGKSPYTEFLKGGLEDWLKL